MSKPEEVLFSDFVVGETYAQNLNLTNVSYTINTLKLIGLSNNILDFITVQFTPPGHLSALARQLGLLAKAALEKSPHLGPHRSSGYFESHRARIWKHTK